MNISWEARDYAKNFSFVYQYGAGVLDLVDPGSGGLAVDLGCGTGALTPKIAEKGYRVLGVDASPEMLALARKGHPEFEFLEGDARSFQLEEKADLIFSNAVFHWIDADQQDALAANLREQLKPGGALVTEFGGRGCAEKVHSALETCFERRGLHYPRTFYFPTIGEYAPLLEKNGFRVRTALLFDRPTAQNTKRGLVDWIEMFVKKPFEGMPGALKAEILDEAEEMLREALCADGVWRIDYVRIRIRAVRL